MVKNTKEHLILLEKTSDTKLRSIARWLLDQGFDVEQIMDKVVMTINHDYNIEMYWLKVEDCFSDVEDSSLLNMVLIATASHIYDKGECFVKVHCVFQEFIYEDFLKLSCSRN